MEARKNVLKVIAFPGAPNLPIFAAMEHGFFADSGVEVELATTPSSVFQFEKLAAGDFDIAMTAYDNAVAYIEGVGAVTKLSSSCVAPMITRTSKPSGIATAPWPSR